MHDWKPADWALKHASRLPFGRLSNFVLSPPAPKGDLSQIHPRDPNEVTALWAAYGEYTWSGAAAQGAYVLHHAPLQQLCVDAVFIRSTKDTFVSDSTIAG